MNKNDFIKYANSFQALARLKLESISLLMDLLGNPQDNLKFIHVAGTNGKGSFCYFMQNILSDAGYVTGRYISPNMVKVNERITIDGTEITDNELESLLDKVSEKAKEVQSKLGDIPTQFEIWTAAAFCYFAEKKCDYVVLETGLGGERDATNIIKNPVISVITRIALDHTEYLGDTLTDIAKAKAGIIKPSIHGGCTVTVPQENEVIDVLTKTATQHQNEFITVKSQLLHEYNGQCEVFDYGNIKDLKITMLGTHQTENAALAIECAKKLEISEKFIRSGIFKAKNPGRLDIISEKPLILFDGAHNKNGMQSLSDNLIRYFNNYDKCFIMGFMKDKDITGAVNKLKENNLHKNSQVYTVTVKDNQRAISSEELAQILNSSEFNATACDSLKTALTFAASQDRLIIICGSLYLYKDLKECDFL